MNNIFDLELFHLGNYSLKTYNLLYLAILIIIVFFALKIVKWLIYRTAKLDTAKKYSFNKLLMYIIAVISFLISLNLLGFNISVLLAGSAAILVGIGFGLQHLFYDIISGIILLLDSTLKVGDIIEVNGMICRVEEINFRTITVIARDDSCVIIPNSELTSNRVINWTHNRNLSRFKIDIGVDYSTDIDRLMKILKEVALRNDYVQKDPFPFVRFEDYGDSALLFSLYFYSSEIFRIENIKSAIRIDIFKTLKENEISIPFPQRDVHIKNK